MYNFVVNTFSARTLYQYIKNYKNNYITRLYMNFFIILIWVIVIIWTIGNFWFDLRSWWNTGDSFAEGYSVYADENIAALLREYGFRTISLGKGANGPLLELASIKEYAEPLNGKVVLWMFYPNDFQNLIDEMES